MFTTPSFSSFTGSQVIIPVGTRAFDISVVSGSAYIGGRLYLAGARVTWTSPDAKVILGDSFAVGTTGSANYVTAFWAA